jgi:hypothetical protein
MNEDDPRCCGSGTCIIDPEGRCWCGQQWDGEKMVSPSLQDASAGGQQTAGSSSPDAG